MFLWGIYGQIWAVRWADFNYKQHPKVVPTRSISETLRTTLLKIRWAQVKTALTFLYFPSQFVSEPSPNRPKKVLIW